MECLKKKGFTSEFLLDSINVLGIEKKMDTSIRNRRENAGINLNAKQYSTP